MDTQFLSTEAKKLLALPKGILAIDESMPTCNKRFEKLGIPTTEENRRKYRELLITTPGIEECISGMILFDETIRQSTAGGVKFSEVFKQKGMSIGIKVDKGTFSLALHPGETITEGLDGLRERFTEYKAMGASFAKWRAFPVIDKALGLPSDCCLEVNAHAMGRYAALAQEAGIVPIVEPEVNMEGTHTIEECYAVNQRALQFLFTELKKQRAYIPGVILKTGMIITGTKCEVQATKEQVAEMTIKCLKENVPADIGGIVFLSGGQSEMQACENLRTMHQMGDLPWALSFSYGRAIQSPALKAWAANMEDVAGAQALLLENARNNSNAVLGK